MLRTSYEMSLHYYYFGMQMPGRSYNSTEYRYGFNGKEKDDEIKGSSGTSYDFGARMYDPRLGRWLSLDPLAKKYSGWSPYHFGFCSPIIVIDPNGKENIIVIGGADKGQKDRYKFINSGLGAAFKTAAGQPTEQTTIVLVTANMTAQEIKEVQASVAAGNASGAQNVNIVIASSAGELVNYVNSKSTTNSDLSKGRTDDKITDVSTFGHGVPGELAFGYDYNPERSAEEEKTGVGPDEIANLNPEAFDNATIQLFNCNTAKDKDGVNIAKDLSKQTNSTVEGYSGQTSYKGIYGIANRLFTKLGIKIQPASNTPSGGDNATKKVYKNGEEVK